MNDTRVHVGDLACPTLSRVPNPSDLHFDRSWGRQWMLVAVMDKYIRVFRQLA
jgi:hypothetical protein